MPLDADPLHEAKDRLVAQLQHLYRSQGFTVVDLSWMLAKALVEVTETDEERAEDELWEG